MPNRTLGTLTYMETVGSRIRKRREELKISQAALARTIGIKPPSLADIESGRTKRPSGEVLSALGRALERHPDYFLTGNLSKLSPGEAAPDGMMNIAVTSREELILELIRTLTPEQQEEMLAPLRAAYAANQVTQKNLGSKIQTIGNRRLAAMFGKPGDEKVRGGKR